MKFQFTSLILAAASLSSSSPTHCTTSLALAGIYTNTSIPMGGNPLTPLDSAMLPSFNSTTVEDWSFDFVSSSADAGLSITLSRGTAGGRLAAQRVILAVVWPDGKRYQKLFYFEESAISRCGNGPVVGSWRNVSSAGGSWTFVASADYKHTVLTVDTEEVKGTYELTSRTPAVYPNGLVYPNTQGNPLFAPLLYWAENVAVGRVDVDFTIGGTPFVFHGMGGRERNWNSKPWGEISGRWNMARGLVGPYEFIVWEYVSLVDGGTYFSAVLMSRGRVVFRTQEYGAGKGSAEIEVKTDGAVHLSSNPPGKPVDSKSTGYVLRMTESGKAWKFDIEFTKPVYWFQASSLYVIGGFVGNVTGGLVGGEQYTGLSSGNLQEMAK
ncbi:hypothetical protein DL96DRAFT_1637393 [Flagelloscypha sp. PMI_526]|nr:hypothetical protein DL96DRAFT_1637393 [Flagelloscypha sp. PMI_526]